MNGLFFQRVSGLTSEEFAENMNNGVVYFVKSGNQYVRVESAAEFDANTIYYIQEVPAVSEELKDRILDKISRIGQYATHVKSILISEGIIGAALHALRDLSRDIRQLFTDIEIKIGSIGRNYYTILKYTMNVDGTYNTTPVRIMRFGIAGQSVTVDNETLVNGLAYDVGHEGYYASGVIASDNSSVFKVYIKRNQYPLHLSFDGAVVVYDTTYENYYEEMLYYEQPLNMSRFNPVKTGHTFLSWGTYPDIMPANAINLVAQFNVNAYTVTWRVDGVDTIDGYYYGETIIAPQDPQKTGYTFTNWTPDIVSIMPDYNLIYTAVFVKNTYQLVAERYRWSDSNPPFETTTYNFEYQEYYNLSVANIAGHTPDKNYVSGIMPANNLTVKIIYTPNLYTVTWDLDGYFYPNGMPDNRPVPIDQMPPEGHSYVQESVYCWDIPTGTTEPSKPGFDFAGWYPAVTSQPAFDITYTARWVEAGDTPYTITVYRMDENGDYDSGFVDTRYGITFSNVVADRTALPDGFYYDTTHEGYNSRGVINPDGSSAFVVYIARQKHNLVFVSNYHAQPSGSTSVRHSSFVEYYYGQTINYPNVTGTHDEYDNYFDGFYADITEFVPFDPASMPTMPNETKRVYLRYVKAFPFALRLNGGNASYSWSNASYDSDTDVLTLKGFWGETFPSITLTKSGYVLDTSTLNLPASFTWPTASSGIILVDLKPSINNVRWITQNPSSTNYGIGLISLTHDTYDHSEDDIKFVKTFNEQSGNAVNVWNVAIPGGLKITDIELQVYSGPGVSYSLVDTVAPNTVITPLEYNGDWVRIGVNRWINGTQLLDKYYNLFTTGVWQDTTLSIWTQSDIIEIQNLLNELQQAHPGYNFLFYAMSNSNYALVETQHPKYYMTEDTIQNSGTTLAMLFEIYKEKDGTITPLNE